MEITEHPAPLPTPLSTPLSGQPSTVLSAGLSTGLSTQDYWTRMQLLREELTELQRSAPAC